MAEPIRNTDVRIPSLQYWQRIREICDRHGVLLILNDIPNSLGRTGHWFSYQHFGIKPDILCIGKGLGGGIVPLAAMLTRDNLNLAKEVSLGHFTHEKSPIACAVALAVIETIEQESLLSKVREDSIYVANRLKKIQEDNLIVCDVRDLGLLWALELQPETRSQQLDEAILYECLRHKLSFRVSHGTTIQISPPLIIERQELARALDILEDALSKVAHRPPFNNSNAI